MASSKVMASSNSRKSDLSRRSSSSSKPQPIVSDQRHTRKNSGTSNIGSITVDGLLRDIYDSNPSTGSTLLDAQITLIDSQMNVISNPADGNPNVQKTVDDVWREIVSGDRRECKEEAPDEMMTLEDFLAKAGAVDGEDVKMSVPPTERLSGGMFTFDSIPTSSFQTVDKVEGSIIGFGNGVEVNGAAEAVVGGGRGKRGRPALEPLDKAAQQRQRRMIKNRESAARSRERKQAYQVELESLAVKLEEENEQLLKEKAERTKERFKQLMEKVIPIVEKRRPPRVLRRVRSMQW
ncbi:G-box-binding factor 4-like [Quillaja saponaria]|uniref:G-box-binding factor 4-like n=1 Tax=Quillaja saponaria TaxID=32244 RepID=A0AAD7M4P0_QUISA|nr:G-box-binding factor 4-like [Quillaja saponaria]